MAKKTVRTPNQQEYRDSLARQLVHLRKSWSKDLAENLLEKSKETTKYKESKKWTDKTIFEQVDAFIFRDPWNSFNSEQKIILERRCKELEEKAPNFTEKEVSVIEGIISKWEWHDSYGYTLRGLVEVIFKREVLEWLDDDFLKRIAKRLWHDTSKNKIVIDILRNRIPNDLNFWADLVNENTRCVDSYSRDDSEKSAWRYMQRDIENNILKTENIESYLEQFAWVEKISHDDAKIIDYFMWRIIGGHINAKISWETLKNISIKMEENHYWFHWFNINMVSDFENLKKELDAKFLAWEDIKLYISLFGDKIWDIIDKSYHVPHYVNNYVEKRWKYDRYLPNSLRLIDEYLDSWEAWNNNEKFTWEILWGSDDTIFEVWSDPEKLKAVDAETLGSRFFPLWYYLYIKHNTTDVDTSKLVWKVLQNSDFCEFWDTDRAPKQLSWWGMPESEQLIEFAKRYSQIPSHLRQKYLETDKPWRFTEFIQDVYATNDNDLLRKLFEFSLWKYSMYNRGRLTYEDQDVLIVKVIDNLISTPEDFEELFDKIKHNYQTLTPFAVMLIYLVTWSVPRNTAIIPAFPQSIYRMVCEEAIAKGEHIPTHCKVVPDPMVRQDLVEKLSALYDKVQAEKQRKQEHEEALRLERERIAREQREATEYALAHCEDWEVVLDYTGEQKYILIVDPESKKLKFISEDLPYHSNIKSKYCPNGLCLWWWRITMNADKTRILLHWSSESYGWLSDHEKECAIKLLKKNYPNLTIL